MAAFQTMNAIKRKMHKLKTDKETEYDRVDQLEQKLVELRTLNEKVTDTLPTRKSFVSLHFTLLCDTIMIKSCCNFCKLRGCCYFFLHDLLFTTFYC